MLGLNLIHVSKSGHLCRQVPDIDHTMDSNVTDKAPLSRATNEVTFVRIVEKIVVSYVKNFDCNTLAAICDLPASLWFFVINSNRVYTPCDEEHMYVLPLIIIYCTYHSSLGISENNFHPYTRILRLYSLIGKTSYRQISWNLEAARLDVTLVVSRQNLKSISAVLLPSGLSNFIGIWKVKTPISPLRVSTWSRDKTSVRLVNGGPGVTVKLSKHNTSWRQEDMPFRIVDFTWWSE